MLSARHHPTPVLARSDRGERGFTLIELVVAMAVLLLVVPQVAGSFHGVARSSRWAEEALDRNNDAQRIASAWTRDVQSVDVDGVKQGSDAAWPGCAIAAGDQHLVSFRSSGSVTSWVAVGSGPALALVRRSCTGGSLVGSTTLARRIGRTGATAADIVHGPSSSPTFCPTSTSNSVTVGRSCTIVIDGSWHYDLTVARRAFDTAATTPPTTVPPTVPPAADNCSTVPGNLVKNCQFEQMNPWNGNQTKPHYWACQANTYPTDLTIWPNDFCGSNPTSGLQGSGNGYVASGNSNFRYVRYEINQGCHQRGSNGRQCMDGSSASDIFLDRTKNYRLRASILKGHSLDFGVWSDFDVELGVRKYYGGTNSEDFLLNIDNAITRVTTPLGAGDNTTYRTYEAYITAADLQKIAGSGPVQVEVFARVFPKNYTNAYFTMDDVSLAPVTSIPANTSVLVNGGFEGGSLGWNLCAARCGVDSAPDYPTPYSRTGLGNGYVNSGGSGSGWNNLFQTVSVTQNTSYRLTAWVRTSANNNAGYFGVRTAGNQVVAEQQFGRLDGYQRVTVDFNSGANTSLQVYAGAWANGSNTWFQIDDASLVTR